MSLSRMGGLRGFRGFRDFFTPRDIGSCCVNSGGDALGLINLDHSSRSYIRFGSDNFLPSVDNPTGAQMRISPFMEKNRFPELGNVIPRQV